jgi:NAD(P)-dependent dehydrogenase (short-subunit alcohol dehydrogenase family)
MSRPVAIITGGAGGLGRALDGELRKNGWTTVLVDLAGPALEAIEQDDRRKVYACDLTDEDALAGLRLKMGQSHPAIDLVIYNAGVTWIGSFDDLTEAVHRRVFDINYFAAANMAHLLRQNVRAERGTHLAISSVAGFSPLAKRTAYAASKHAVEGFFKSLRSEEAAYGVRCVIAAPSFVATNPGRAEQQQDGTSRPGSATDGVDYLSPEAAASTIVAGLTAGKDFIPVGRVARLSWLLYRASPSLFAKIMERKIGIRR